MEINFTPGETFAIVVDKYKKDLEKEIKSLEKKMPKSANKAACSKKRKELEVRIKAKIEKILRNKYPELIKGIAKLTKKFEFEYWGNTIDLGHGYHLEIPETVEIDIRTKDLRFDFTVEIYNLEKFKDISDEAESFSHKDSKLEDEITDLKRELRQAKGNSNVFKFQFKKRLIDKLPEGNKLMKEIAKLDLTKVMKA